MSGLFSGCSDCCGNCQVRLLAASKKRHGFPALYITAIVTGGVKRSKLRYRTKTMSCDYDDWRDATLHNNFNYEAEINVSRIVGEVSYTEDSTLTNGTLSSNRSQAITEINTRFNAYKDLGSGTYVTSGEEGETILGVFEKYYDWTQTDEVTFTYDGVDIIGFSFVRTYERVGATGHEGESGVATTTISVDLSNEYTDTELVADVDDLLTNYDTGTANGVNGLADNTLATIVWNESSVNGSLGNASTGACAIDPTTLDSFTDLDDPAITVTVVDDPSAYWSSTGQWWQHTGGSHTNGEEDGAPGFSVYGCTFTDDASMPTHGLSVTTAAYDVIGRCHYRFNVSTPVCGSFGMVDNASTSTSKCVAASPSGGAVIIVSPEPVTVSNSNIRRPDGGVEFTAPGYLTAGDCPCTNAP